MLQRAQSLWLLLAAVSGALTFWLPFFAAKKADNSYTSVYASNSFILLPLLVATALLALVTIFMYKKRKLQLRLSLLGVLLSILTLILVYSQTKSYTEVTYGLGLLFPFAMIILFILAARGIYQDEKLVKSLDRIR
jgi:peptidoglycan/LPS O-acetylase OafA/YrhL